MIYLTLATFFSGLSFFLVKLVTARLYPVLGNMFSMIAALGTQFAIFAYLKMRGQEMFFTSRGIMLSLLMGLCVGFYTFFLYMAFTKMDVSKATPMLYLGSLAIATLLSVLFLKESFNSYNFIGLLLAGVSIFLLFWK